MFERCTLADHPSLREAREVRRQDPVAVEHAKDVIDRVVKAVARPAGRIFGRKAGVSLVVADDEAAPGGEPAAEFLGPPQHRGHSTHAEKYRRINRIAECLGGKLDILYADRSKAHATSIRHLIGGSSPRAALDLETQNVTRFLGYRIRAPPVRHRSAARTSLRQQPAHISHTSPFPPRRRLRYRSAIARPKR